MIPPELVKKIVEQAKAKKAESTPNYEADARKAAVKKLMAAVRDDNEDAFLQAFSEFKDIDN